MSVLLEAFSPSLTFGESSPGASSPNRFDTSPQAMSDPRLDGKYYSTMPHLMPSLPLTGLSPGAVDPPSKLVHSNSDGVENLTCNEQNASLGKPRVVGENDTVRMEAMHIACKGLLILVKFLEGHHIKVIIDIFMMLFENNNWFFL